MIDSFGQALVASLQSHPFAYVYGGIAVNVALYSYVIIGTVRLLRSKR